MLAKRSHCSLNVRLEFLKLSAFNKPAKVFSDRYALLHCNLRSRRIRALCIFIHKQRAVAENKDIVMSRGAEIRVDFDSAAHILKTGFLHNRMAADTCRPYNGLRFDLLWFFIFFCRL